MSQRKNKAQGDLSPVTPSLMTGGSSAPSPKLSPKDSPTGKNSKLISDTRNADEIKLFDLVKAGKLEDAQAKLRENGDNIDVNALDTDDVDLLTQAVKKKNEKLVEFVLSISPNTIITADALLEAIKLNAKGIVEKILEVAEKRDQNTDTDTKMELAESFQKRADKVRLPPFVQAATSGHYKMLELFYKRGDRMPELHEPACDCHKCNPLTGMLYTSEGLMSTSEENILIQLGKIDKKKAADDETNEEETTTNAEGSTTETESAYSTHAKKGKKEKKSKDKKKEEKGKVKPFKLWTKEEKAKVRALQKKERFVKRNLYHIKRRIGILTAKANPKFMIFMSSKDGDFDPVYECFKLSKIAKQWAKKDPDFNTDYKKISKNADALPQKLLDLCRTTEETSILLGVREGYVGAETECPRLGYAIICKQKEFVAHHHSQCLMYREWLGAVRWNARDSCEHFVKNVAILIFMLAAPALAPILWILHIFGCNAKLFRVFMAPVNRARAKFGSYFWFCVLLFVISYRDRSRFDISPAFDLGQVILHFLVAIYTLSFLFANLRHFLYNPSWYLRRRWNLYDIILIILLILSQGYALDTYWNYGEESKGYEELISRETLFHGHPLLKHEMWLAITTTVAMCRVFRILILDHRVGPVQTALGKMFNAFKSYAIVFVILFATVAVGMRLLVVPYQHVTDKAPSSSQLLDIIELGNKITHGGIKRGDVELQTPKKTVVIEGKKEVVENPQETTQYFLYIIVLVFGVVYKFLKAIFTGMMSNTRKTVQKAKEVEWRYLRTQEWLYHIQDSTIAYPCNMIPTCDCICKFGKCCLRRKNVFNEWKEWGKAEERHDQYPFLMRRLFQRYFQGVDAADASKPPTKGDVEKIQKSITAIRQIGNSLVDEEVGSEDGHVAGSQTEEEEDYVKEHLDRLVATSSSRAGSGDGAEEEEESTMKVVMPPKSMGSF